MPPVEMLAALRSSWHLLRSFRPLDVSDREARIAYSLKIAGQIEVDVGALDDVPTATTAAVDDRGIKGAPG